MKDRPPSGSTRRIEKSGAPHTIIGGISGGTLGALAGNKLAQGPLAGVDRDLRARMLAHAGWIDDRPPGARQPAAAPAPRPA